MNNPDKADIQAIRQAFQQLRETNRRLSELGEEAASSNSLLSPALEEEIAAIQKIFAEAEGDGDGI